MEGVVAGAFISSFTEKLDLGTAVKPSRGKTDSSKAAFAKPAIESSVPGTLQLLADYSAPMFPDPSSLDEAAELQVVQTGFLSADFIINGETIRDCSCV